MVSAQSVPQQLRCRRAQLPFRQPDMLHVVRLVDAPGDGDGRRPGVPERHRSEHVPVGVQGLERVGHLEQHGRTYRDAGRGGRGRAAVRHLVVHASPEEEDDVLDVYPHDARHLPLLPDPPRVLAAVGTRRQERAR